MKKKNLKVLCASRMRGAFYFVFSTFNLGCTMRCKYFNNFSCFMLVLLFYYICGIDCCCKITIYTYEISFQKKTSIEYQNDDDDRFYIFVLYKFIYGWSTYVYLLVLNTLCYFLVEDGNVFWSFNELNLKRFKKV